MNLYDIPGLNGYKTALGSWGLMLTGLAGVLATVSTALLAVASLLSGTMSFADFATQISPLIMSLGAAFGGLSGIGLGHKLEKSKSLLMPLQQDNG